VTLAVEAARAWPKATSSTRRRRRAAVRMSIIRNLPAAPSIARPCRAVAAVPDIPPPQTGRLVHFHANYANRQGPGSAKRSIWADLAASAEIGLQTAGSRSKSSTTRPHRRLTRRASITCGAMRSKVAAKSSGTLVCRSREPLRSVVVVSLIVAGWRLHHEAGQSPESRVPQFYRGFKRSAPFSYCCRGLRSRGGGDGRRRARSQDARAKADRHPYPAETPAKTKRRHARVTERSAAGNAVIAIVALVRNSPMRHARRPTAPRSSSGGDGNEFDIRTTKRRRARLLHDDMLDRPDGGLRRRQREVTEELQRFAFRAAAVRRGCAFTTLGRGVSSCTAATPA